MSKFSQDPAYQAFRILQVTFIVAPIAAGIDKFFYTLTNWSNYLAPFVLKMINYHDTGFMMVVGAIEIIAGIGVLFKPRIFSYIISLWLLGIIFNLLLTGHYFDVALRDVGLMLAAISLGRLSSKYAA
jgi:uncharacterized membrane protein HdeD (DUF308 family)